MTQAERRRTFAIISHPDAGKTTLTEKLLLFGGAVQSAGAVKARGEAAARALRLDGDRAGARHFRDRLGDDVRVRLPHLQPARHAGPPGFQRGHVSHAHRRRFRRNGDRLRQGHRDADAQAVRSLPPARRAHRHLRQQARPRGPRALRSARRDFRGTGPRHLARHLAHRHGRRFQGLLRPAARPPAALRSRPRRPCDRIHHLRGPRRPETGGRPARQAARQAARRGRAGARRIP